MEEYIKLLEIILKIKIDLHFGELKGTKMGEADVLNGTITLNKNNDNFTNLFSLAHEARHIYQYEYDRQNYDYENYIDGKDGMSQKVEMDANAFAYFVCRDIFGLAPTIGLDKYDGFISLYDNIKKQYHDIKIDRKTINKILDVFGLPNIDQRNFKSPFIKTCHIISR